MIGCVRVDPRRLLESLDVEVAEDQGNELVARCPSGKHPDRNPSWTMHVGGEKNAVHVCRSCGFSGDAYTLAGHVLGVGFAVAKEWVEEHSVKKEDEKTPSSVELELRLRAPPRRFVMPAGFEHAPLEDWPTPARAYAEQRGITARQVEEWGIGYALEGRLAGRIVVPIADRELVERSYVARTFSGQPVRYLTPRGEEGADPSAVFGESDWGARSSSAKMDVVVVCEGALNALAVERASTACVAALGGSRVDPGAAAKIARWFDGAIVLTDSDASGEKAWAQLEAMLGRHVRLVRARMPAGVDPASAPPGMVREIVGSATSELW